MECALQQHTRPHHAHTIPQLPHVPLPSSSSRTYSQVTKLLLATHAVNGLQQLAAASMTARIGLPEHLNYEALASCHPHFKSAAAKIRDPRFRPALALLVAVVGDGFATLSAGWHLSAAEHALGMFMLAMGGEGRTLQAAVMRPWWWCGV